MRVAIFNKPISETYEETIRFVMFLFGLELGRIFVLGKPPVAGAHSSVSQISFFRPIPADLKKIQSRTEITLS